MTSRTLRWIAKAFHTETPALPQLDVWVQREGPGLPSQETRPKARELKPHTQGGTP